MTQEISSPPTGAPEIDIGKAVNTIIARNHAKDPNYAPYCGRCSGLHRMSVVEPFYFRHSCGAEHDERACIVNGRQKENER